MKIKTPITLLTVVAAALTLSSRAHANPRPLPFTYPYETLPEGSAEIEQYVDATWVRTPSDPAATDTTFAPNYLLQTELEYGITDHLEMGAYVVFSQQPNAAADPTLTFEGVKYRLRYRFAEEGEWPVDTAVYLEGAAFHDEYEIEGKVILGKRIGKLKLMANAWVEEEWERGKDAAFIINPTIGATYQLDPKLFLGIEYWARGQVSPPSGLDDVDAFNAKVHHFLGPAVSMMFGKVWLSVGVYARLDELSRSSMVGDQYGKIWVRSVLGLDL
jgi:hypothetical protein